MARKAGIAHRADREAAWWEEQTRGKGPTEDRPTGDRAQNLLVPCSHLGTTDLVAWR